MQMYCIFQRFAAEPFDCTGTFFIGSFSDCISNDMQTFVKIVDVDWDKAICWKVVAGIGCTMIKGKGMSEKCIRELLCPPVRDVIFNGDVVFICV